MRIGALVAALLLSACATAPAPGPAEAPWITGRLSVHIDATPTQPAQGLNAAFELRGGELGGELHLNTALGTRMVSARWGQDGAVLVTPQGEQRFASLDALAREALGEDLPLAALPDWLAGRPWPQAAHVAEPGGFAQLGWQIDLQRHAEGWLHARRAREPAVSLRARIDPP